MGDSPDNPDGLPWEAASEEDEAPSAAELEAARVLQRVGSFMSLHNVSDAEKVTAMDVNGDGTVCGDVDNCAGPTNCAPDAICRNTTANANGYVCICPPGYEGNGTTCTEIDECAREVDICDEENAVCANTPGSFTCTCDSGFYGDGVTCTACSVCSSD